MKTRWLAWGCLSICIIGLTGYFALSGFQDYPSAIRLRNAAGAETREFQPYESVLFSAYDLEPRMGYTVRILREDGEIIDELELSSDQEGRIPETVIWYDIGLPPYGEIPVDRSALPYLSEYVGRHYVVEVLLDDYVMYESEFFVAPEVFEPVLYASDPWGTPKSGFLVGEEDVWVVGQNLPAGSIIRLWAVPAQAEWTEDDPLAEATGQYPDGRPSVFELGEDQTSFKRLLWSKEFGSVGSYDVVAEVIAYPSGAYRRLAVADVQTLVSYPSISGFVIQKAQEADEPLEMNLAGTLYNPLTYQEMFLPNENVYVGIDPKIQPTYKTMSADVYVVKHRTKLEWQANPTLNVSDDVTGSVETITIQYVCGNWWKTLVWPAPLVPGEYDVVLDFNQNGSYDSSIDLIDALDPVGFTVSEVRVDKISFNYPGAGAITIYDNAQGANIPHPEYAIGTGGSNREAAWVRGGTHTVKVEFKAVSGITSIQVWAETGLGGLASSTSPVPVSLPGGSGSAVFTVNQVPNSVGKHQFYWDWKYKKTTGGTLPMGLTGQHTVYTTLATPVSPMTVPWLEILDYACTWAPGQMTKPGVCDAIINNGFVNHYAWNYQCHRLASDFVRLISTQGVAGSQTYWGSINGSVIGNMDYQRTEPFDPVGGLKLKSYDWYWHQWAAAEGMQRDPSAAKSLAGLWGAYEDYAFKEYRVVASSTPYPWVANHRPGQNQGCEAAQHRSYSGNPTLYSWYGPNAP